MASIKLNSAQRISAYHIAIAWGTTKKAGGSHARRLVRICDRLRIDELEEEDRLAAALPTPKPVERRHDAHGTVFELDEADMEFYRSLMREYFDKQEGLPDYFFVSGWRVMLGLMEAIDATYGGARALKAVE